MWATASGGRAAGASAPLALGCAIALSWPICALFRASFATRSPGERQASSCHLHFSPVARPPLLGGLPLLQGGWGDLRCPSNTCLLFFCGCACPRISSIGAFRPAQAVAGRPLTGPRASSGAWDALARRMTRRTLHVDELVSRAGRANSTRSWLCERDLT